MRSRREVRWFRVLVLTLPAVVAWAGCAQIARDHGPDMVGALTWPDGDAHRGLEAFKDLKCATCHKVASIPDLAALNEEQIGPSLDHPGVKPARMDILVQIVAPGTDPSIRTSHMGNYDDVMTVAQLTDLIAFVESIQGDARPLEIPDSVVSDPRI